MKNSGRSHDGDLPDRSRRQFIMTSGGAVAGVSVASSFGALLAKSAAAGPLSFSPDYGRLREVLDQTTGLPLLKLPEGFSYSSFGWTNEALEDGTPTPGGHDGMGVIKQSGHTVIMVRNHEIRADRPSFARGNLTYDPNAGGGCTILEFDSREGRWQDARIGIGGTSTNCAGGATPWDSWLSCEETLVEPGAANRYTKTHGWIFEVPANARAKAEPLTAMGRFLHEAVAVDPLTGYVYETEDRRPCGLYRFVPKHYGELERGGELQMLKIAGRDNADLRNFDAAKALPVGSQLAVEWVPIDDPQANTTATYDQGASVGGAAFSRLEGCWYSNGRIYFVSTDGSPGRQGQVWQLDTYTDTLTLVFESPAADLLNNPDNITVSPRGGILLCEDGGGRLPLRGEQMIGLTLDGQLFPFAENNIVLGGQKGFSGDFRRREWAGATFSADGRWLFANIQTPGVSFAITGPWQQGGL